jgi:rRNA-processing protein EBP2
MMKSDAHMQKVKDKLILEAKRIAVVDTRRKDKAAAKFGKQVAAEKAAERAGEKRKHLDALKQWRTKKDVGAAPHGGRSGGGKSGGAAAGASARAAEVEGILSDKPPPFHSGARPSSAPAAGGKGRGGKARVKDKKYGFGGQKHSRKENTAKSSASLKEFSVARNRALPPGMAGRRPSSGGSSRGGPPKARKGGERAGQRARQASRSHSAAKGGARRG